MQVEVEVFLVVMGDYGDVSVSVGRTLLGAHGPTPHCSWRCYRRATVKWAWHGGALWPNAQQDPAARLVAPRAQRTHV